MEYYYEDLESEHHDEWVVWVEHYEDEIEELKVVGRCRYHGCGVPVERLQPLPPEMAREFTARFMAHYERDENLRDRVREEVLDHIDVGSWLE